MNENRTFGKSILGLTYSSTQRPLLKFRHKHHLPWGVCDGPDALTAEEREGGMMIGSVRVA
jgi:hypothetical protein